MKLTNEIKAQVLREEADYYYNRGERVFGREVAASLRARADKYDPPRPEPGTVV